MQSDSGQVMCLAGFGNSKQVVLVGSRNSQLALWALNRNAPVKLFALPENAGAPLCLASDGGDTILAGTSGKMVVQYSMK